MSKYNPVCTKLNNYYIVSYRNMSPNTPPPPSSAQRYTQQDALHS